MLLRPALQDCLLQIRRELQILLTFKLMLTFLAFGGLLVEMVTLLLAVDLIKPSQAY